ncbi:MAG: hypothetical protein HYX34_04175 [Actinobacteria bacterium]|nr:hypothetical protein [Actinomycetota bacterium]
MASKAAAQRQRERKRVARARSAHDVRARDTQRRQAQAAAARRRRAPDPRRRHATAYAMWAVAGVLGVLDFLVYTNVVAFMSASVATLALGGPMVGLAVAGALVYGS